ncbi:hypothetical protein ACH4TC_39285 [Streptomyces spororaveus]|uniref:hypothetical protein n=1 Tax=Streptomyces spororaveus TaxID=284039 RepID=UPI003791DEE3
MPAPAGGVVVVDVQNELGDRAAAGERQGERTGDPGVAGMGLLQGLGTVFNIPIYASISGAGSCSVTRSR